MPFTRERAPEEKTHPSAAKVSPGFATAAFPSVTVPEASSSVLPFLPRPRPGEVTVGLEMVVVVLLVDQVMVPPVASADDEPVADLYSLFSALVGGEHLLIVTVVLIVPVSFLHDRLDAANAGDDVRITTTDAGTESAVATAAAIRTRRIG